MPAEGSSTRVPVEERLFSLVLALLATDSGLTKNEILSTVQGYSQKYSHSGDNSNLERQFERDKDDIRELVEHSLVPRLAAEPVSPLAGRLLEQIGRRPTLRGWMREQRVKGFQDRVTTLLPDRPDLVSEVMRAFAEAQPRWRFVGVDPSAEMLKLARRTLGPLADRAELHEGYVASAPTGPFDGASCLLTLHFVSVAERLATLTQIRSRLKPGAPFVAAHHSMPEGPERDLWLDRFAAFAADNGVVFDKAKGGARGLGDQLPILTPEAEVDLLRAAGFVDPQLFYAAFTFRGWVARA